MVSFIVKRFIQSLITLLVVATLIFFMFRLMPGDMTAALIDPSIAKEARDQVIKQYGLDQSIWSQYLIFLQDLLKFDFGQSFYYKRSTLAVLSDKFLATIILMFSSMVVAYGFGVFGGALIAWKRGSFLDLFWTTFALIFRSAPTFWVGLLAIYVFSVTLGWLPHSGIRSPGYDAKHSFDLFFSVDFLRHLLLPTIVTGLFYLATPLLLMRNTMIDVLGEDYIEMARAKGLRERRILFHHAMRNALLPVVTAGALFIGSALGGQVMIEYVFSWPGLGQEMILAAQRHDYPLAQTAFLLMAGLIMMMNVFADIIYAFLDPRITYK
ncbi:peptide ABC transporter permease [Ammoniphilus oxalaticus]|uniref:Peptide ABC transporter permease n=1 Tax=Ammoniphilus oxalaticus TaxID=66863 RepID=A0A419SGI7_9BACL|nr:ABC transporter permease [Ammoniphilus oxalaticus]RKD22855.1 peptide ABC transporter permease [Ammoniphilus oxalaticus]